MGTEILQNLGYAEGVITAVCETIDGHDTRPDPHHLNDRIVRDADKLWRFEVAGMAVASDWFGLTPRAYADRLEVKVLPKLETQTGRAFALEALKQSRAALMLHVL